jgi:HD-GYP domain-containing protein (c-di-GMP phosphodiesterase class II)
MGVRSSQLMGSLALATDLGTGQPLARALRTCVLGVAIGRALNVDEETVRDIHQFALLRFLGCTSDAAEVAAKVTGDEGVFLAAMAPTTMGSPAQQVAALLGSVAPGATFPVRASRLARVLADPGWGKRSLSTHCEVAVRLGEKLGCRNGVLESLAHAYERWDGKGIPVGLAGEAIPLPVRVVVVAGDVDLFFRRGGRPAVQAMLGQRRGRAYDPAVLDACAEVAAEELARPDSATLWEETMDSEPTPHARLDESALDGALTGVADFTDLKSPWLRGHSRRVARLAEGAGRWCGLADRDVTVLRRAALVHDIGRVGVPTTVDGTGGGLGVQEQERERLHPYLTERVLAQCAPLEPYTLVAATHHERIDGNGYHRGLRGPQLNTCARLLAAADMLDLLATGRPGHTGLDPDTTKAVLRSAAKEGALDPAAVEAVLGAQSGSPPHGHHRLPAGLTERESEVLALLARGQTNQQIATHLHLSAKTVGRHVENLYAKTQTHSRAAAAVYALENGILSN